MKKNSALSCFDLDHTLLNVNSSFKFGQYLYKKGVFSFLTMLNLAAYYGLHKAGFYSISSLHHSIFSKLFLGRSSLSFLRYAESFVEENLPSMLYVPAMEELEKARKNGHFVVILSSSPYFLVEIIAKKIHVAHWKASHYSLDEHQRFSHISSLVLGEDKAYFVRRFAKDLAVKYENITAFTDSIFDLPFLESAGKKIVVNPDMKLRKLCVQNNWKII